MADICQHVDGLLWLKRNFLDKKKHILPHLFSSVQHVWLVGDSLRIIQFQGDFH